MGHSWEDLGALTCARQFPAVDGDVATLLERVGPIQSQTARSSFLGLAARFPGVTHAAITEAFETSSIVRGSTIRGTVHTATPTDFTCLATATAVGQRTLWQRLLTLERSTLEELWADTETYAAAQWRTPDELTEHLREWIADHESPATAERVLGATTGRYLAFGHGGLVRRPLKGAWEGQGAPVYRTLSALTGAPQTRPTLRDVVRLHLTRHGPASRHDLAWWSGVGLRRIDETVANLGLVGTTGPDGRAYLDLTERPSRRELTGVRLLPEFDALMCGYDPAARQRFGDHEHLRRLWNPANGMVLPPLLVDGRITGWWRAAGSARTRPLEVHWFAGTRRPRRAELAEPVAALEDVLNITISSLTVTRAT